MLVRLYIAVFLTYFKEELHRQEKNSNLVTRNNNLDKIEKQLGHASKPDKSRKKTINQNTEKGQQDTVEDIHKDNQNSREE